jgi:regulator of replication initiation timing
MLSILVLTVALCQVPDFSSVSTMNALMEENRTLKLDFENEKAKNKLMVDEVSRLRSHVKDLESKLRPKLENEDQVTRVIVIKGHPEIPRRYERTDKWGYIWSSEHKPTLEKTVEELNSGTISHPYGR